MFKEHDGPAIRAALTVLDAQTTRITGLILVK